MVRPDIPPGTLVLLVLQTLLRGPMHGYGIAQHIQQTTDGVLEVEEGTLYPALQKMLMRDWVSAEWRVTENNRRARYYRLTAAGRRQLARELERYRVVTVAIQHVIGTA